MNPTIVTVVFATILLKETVTAYDYCQKNLNCQADAKHIGCGITDDFGPNCPTERTLIPMTADLKAYFLRKHNQARSDIANGKIAGYLTASRMVEMTWDDELAKLAEYNAKSCTYGHDQCRNTATHKYAGQNIAMVMSTPNYFEPIKAVDYLFGLWFDEYKDCDMSYINKYRSSDTGKRIGHFTQIVSAGANRVGCAVTTFADSRKNVYIVCNYSLTNILNRSIYTAGTPCTGCTKGCSTTYPGLCNAAEVIPFP